MTRKHNSRVLVVDDEEPFCFMLLHFLERENFGCRCALEPAQALAMLDQDVFDLVISDISMPHMSGLELLGKIRRDYPGIPVIIMTAFTSEYNYSEIIRAGAADFIEKPLNLQELKAKIERIEREREMLHQLEETNTALGVVLKRIEGEKDKLRSEILANLKQSVFPFLTRLEATRLDEKQKFYLERLSANLSKIASPLTTCPSDIHASLSQTEIQVATLIKNEMSNKEIAEMLAVSINTVTTHRYHLRTKLNLKNKKVNLKSYLKSIDF